MSDDDTLTARIRRRFRPPAAADPWLAVPRKILRFGKLAVSKAGADNLGQQAAALAFTTVLSLVPLLAALSFLGARWFDDKQDRTVELLSQILPYPEEKILSSLQEFLQQAQSIQGIGFVAFILTSMAVFTSIEATINRIWNVPHKRPFKVRLLSFTLLLFWGPVVIGAGYTVLFYLRQRSPMGSFADSLPVRLIPFVVTVLGLSMLYWLVPYTRVLFRNAFAGGLTAALLLEVLGQGFGIFVVQVRNFSVIYGGFGLVLFFMLSIQLAWWIVLLGSEVAYSLQNAAYMSSRRRPAAPLDGGWIALTALVFITERFRSGRPVTPHELLAERMSLASAELSDVLAPLIEAGVLCDASGDTEGYLLACDPHELEVSRVFELYEGGNWELLRPFEGEPATGLEDLRTRLAAERARQSEGIVLAQLAGAGESPAVPGAHTEPAPADQRVRGEVAS
ncbi:MAG: YihY family inner membrane protein [bacterium]|nr:YihY family inner membrane protein [bacterium]